jgi:hypothetical protein
MLMGGGDLRSSSRAAHLVFWFLPQRHDIDGGQNSASAAGVAESCAQVGEMLGHENRWGSEEFLAAHGVWPGTTLEELGSDIATLDRV